MIANATCLVLFTDAGQLSFPLLKPRRSQGWYGLLKNGPRVFRFIPEPCEGFVSYQNDDVDNLVIQISYTEAIMLRRITESP